MVFSGDNDVNRAVLSNNGPTGFDMALHPNARWILGASNIAFMHGPGHKALRNSFLTLFRPSSLEKYLELQEAKVHEAIDLWLKQTGGRPTEMRPLVRDLNLATSQTVFLGKYVPDAEAFNQHYLNMTTGFVVAPIPLPGTALWRAIQSRKAVVATITTCCEKSKAAMRAGTPPTCLLDFWTQRCLEDEDEAKASGKAVPAYTISHNMAETMMDFLFAAQDASTASLCWVLALMAEYPDVLRRVREEQAAARPNGEPVTLDMLVQLPFTRQVVLEILRYRPPAMMVPQVANADIKLTESFTAAKGSIVIPSLWASCRNGYADGDLFSPDRFAEDREDTWRAHTKSFMPFGSASSPCLSLLHTHTHTSISSLFTRTHHRHTHTYAHHRRILSPIPTHTVTRHVHALVQPPLIPCVCVRAPCTDAATTPAWARSTPSIT